ncbi:MAG: hypothetical protein ACRD0N_05740, partial [Acidimicrobiales bacterium]
GRALAELAEAAGLGTVVVVRPVAAVAPTAPQERPTQDEEATPEPAPASDDLAGAAPASPAPEPEPVPVPASAVVDLRQRVLSGLLRLRSRPLPRDRRPPGEVASGG